MDDVYYSKIHPHLPGTQHLQGQCNGALFNSQFGGAKLPTTGPICALGLPVQHLGMLEANSRFPEDAHH